MDLLDFFDSKITKTDSHDKSIIDKYNINKTSQFLDNHNEILIIKKWLKNPKQKNGLIVSGPIGCGKTHLISLICKECNFNMVFFDASIKRNKKELMEKYDKVCHSSSKVFILDEMESFCNNEHVSLNNLITWIDKKKNKNGFKIPFIFIINSTYLAKLNDIKIHCQIVHIKYPSSKNIFSKCLQIIENENFDVDLVSLKSFIKLFNGDYRYIINNLQNVSNSNTFKDQELEMYGIFRFLANKHNSFDDKLRYFTMEPGTIPIIFQENYIKWNLDNDVLLRLTKSMCEGDIFHQSQYMKDFDDNLNIHYYSIYSVIYPFNIIYDFDIYLEKVSFGSIWTKQSSKYQKKKYINSLKFTTNIRDIESLSIMSDIYETFDKKNENMFCNYYQIDNLQRKEISKMFSYK